MPDERPEAVRALYRGARRLALGLYERPEGSLVCNAAEVLEQVGLPDTAENRELAACALRELVARAAPDAVVVQLDPE